MSKSLSHEKKAVSLNSIIAHPKFRVRPLDEDHVQRLQVAIESGEKLPPLKVTRNGDQYYLLDGFHRKKAHTQLELEDILVEIVDPKDDAEACLEAVTPNLRNGLPLKIQERKEAARQYLKLLPKVPNRFGRELARLFHFSPDVGADLVSQYKNVDNRQSQTRDNKLDADHHTSEDITAIDSEVNRISSRDSSTEISNKSAIIHQDQPRPFQFIESVVDDISAEQINRSELLGKNSRLQDCDRCFLIMIGYCGDLTTDQKLEIHDAINLAATAVTKNMDLQEDDESDQENFVEDQSPMNSTAN